MKMAGWNVRQFTRLSPYLQLTITVLMKSSSRFSSVDKVVTLPISLSERSEMREDLGVWVQISVYKCTVCCT